MQFFRQHTDGTRTPAPVENSYAGPTRTPCWLIGGGPSLATLDTAALSAAPIPRFCVNLAGTGLFRPQLWTSYDPTARFLPSVYLDPTIVKLLHSRRAMDLVPDTTFKVCECPNTLFFERDQQRGFHNFLENCHNTDGIADWQDSFIQAIHLAHTLGFRRLYLAGCEMCIRPTLGIIEKAAECGVTYRPLELLRDFHDRCRTAGLTDADLNGGHGPPQYHFDESKPLRAAESTDFHYFRVSQYLRLSRRAIALAGLEIISVTPDSRLNDYFEYRPLAAVLAEISRQIGDPAGESTRGRYTSTEAAQVVSQGPMKDRPRTHQSDEL